MRRLYSFIIILTIGIAAGTAGSFWYSRPSETMAATAVVETFRAGERRAEDRLLPQPDGCARHLSRAEEGLHGDGLHPRLCRRTSERGTVKVSLDKIQRTGVKTERVEARPIVRTVRAVGRVEHDEALLTIVTVRSDGYIEELFVNKTGQHVEEGRAALPPLQLANSVGAIGPDRGHAHGRAKDRSRG